MGVVDTIKVLLSTRSIQTASPVISVGAAVRSFNCARQSSPSILQRPIPDPSWNGMDTRHSLPRMASTPDTDSLPVKASRWANGLKNKNDKSPKPPATANCAVIPPPHPATNAPPRAPNPRHAKTNPGTKISKRTRTIAMANHTCQSVQIMSTKVASKQPHEARKASYVHASLTFC